MKKLFLLSILFVVSHYCNSQTALDTSYLKNQIFILPLSPISHGLAAGYERLLSPNAGIGLIARYFFQDPDEIIEPHGFNGTLFYKLRVSAKAPKGFYSRFSFTAGQYHSTAVYREKGNPFDWWGGNTSSVSDTVSFISVGPGFDFGYEWYLGNFSIDVFAGAKYLILPGSVGGEHHGRPLQDLWGNKNWYDPGSPGSVITLSLFLGYRF